MGDMKECRLEGDNFAAEVETESDGLSEVLGLLSNIEFEGLFGSSVICDCGCDCDLSREDESSSALPLLLRLPLPPLAPASSSSLLLIAFMLSFCRW